MRILFKILLISIIFLSCKDKMSEPQAIDTSYYPLKLGNKIIYDVEKIKVDIDIDLRDTSIYQQMEYIESVRKADNGTSIYRIEILRRADEISKWEIKKVWQAYFENNKLVKVEDNYPFVKLTFPLNIGDSWDINVYNDYEKQNCKITTINVAEEINSSYFESVLSVLQKDEESFIDKKYQEEKFAKNIGLIYKIKIDVEDKKLTNPEKNILDRFTLGTIETMKIVQ